LLKRTANVTTFPFQKKYFKEVIWGFRMIFDKKFVHEISGAVSTPFLEPG
jgi:hypothetical protein